MRAPVSQALMVIALRCLGSHRREWADAMGAEFGEALAEGRPFPFAVGCLIAAWGEMFRDAEGRHVIASYGIALGLLIPAAAFQFAPAFEFSSVVPGAGGHSRILLRGLSANPLLGPSQLDAGPSLLALWFLLGLGHLRLAWVLLEQDWTRVIKAGALIGAALATLVMLTAVLGLDASYVILQAAVMAIELTALVLVASQHTQLLSDAGPAITAL